MKPYNPLQPRATLLFRLATCALLLAHPAQIAHAAESASLREGKLEVKTGKTVNFTWQIDPVTPPTGGPKYATGAFLHSLRTPAGFEWTTIQPADHLHHVGLWWPWKYIEVNGQKYNCWEPQEGQGRRVAQSVKELSAPPGTFAWEFSNSFEVLAPGAEPQTAILETARVALKNEKDAQIIDVEIKHQAAGAAVTVLKYVYSGFSWRGPLSWNKDNSRMTTSEGLERDTANDEPARWVVVSGPTPTGCASVLMMSAASKRAGAPERLRVWNSKIHDGTPFVNFNPVMNQSLPLDGSHPAVSDRKYRIVAADREIDAATAEAAWRKWMGGE